MPAFSNINISNKITALHFLAFLVTVFLAFRHLIFDEDAVKEEYQTAISAISICFLSWIVFMVTLAVMDKLVKDDMKNDKLLFMVMFGTMTCFGLFSRIMVLFDAESFWFYVYISQHGIIMAQIVYIVLFVPHHIIIYQKADKIVWIIIALHLFFLIFSISAAVNHAKASALISCQLLFSPISVLASVEFYSIFAGNYLRVNPGEMIKVTSVVHEEQECCALVMDDFGGKMECKICLLPFNQCSRTPRVLKCGHTVCEHCAEQLLEKSSHQYVECPFCKIVTDVLGPANLLPKNFILLEMYHEHKEQMEAAEKIEV